MIPDTPPGLWCDPALLLLFSMLPSAVVVRAPEDTILYWNEEAVKLYGWTASEAVGKLSAALLFTRLPVPHSAMEADLERHGTWTGSVSRLTRGGQRIDVDYRAIRMRRTGELDPLEVEITWGAAREKPAGASRERGPAVETLLEKLRGLKTSNAALTSENQTLRRLNEEVAERERRRLTLLTQENARLRDLLAQVCLIAAAGKSAHT